MACSLPIILGCKLTSGQRGVSDTVRAALQVTSRGTASTYELLAQGQGQIHLGLLSSQLPSIVSDPLVSHTFNIPRDAQRESGILFISLMRDK